MKPATAPSFFRLRFAGMVMSLLLWLTGCATPVVDDADRLARAGAHREAYEQLDAAWRAAPGDATLRAARARQLERLVFQTLAQADRARSTGRYDEAQQRLDQVRQLDSAAPRLAAMEAEVARARSQELQVAQARKLWAAGRGDAAAALVREVLSVSPGHPAARALQQQWAAQQAGESPVAPLPPQMAATFQKPVTLEFRDAPLRQVFEALARSTPVNFVFDKDVRGDARVTVFLRNVTLDEALGVILATQQLDRKLLNDSTVLVYPNTQAKQREHQELITRTIYLTNADVKQALTLVRTLAKTRDLHADERLNALIVRDTAEVVRQVEKLLAGIDLPEPEVMLEVEVMEVSADKLDQLGLSWPTEVQYGVPGFTGQVSRGDSFRVNAANPLLVATLSGNTGNANLLANPTIRVRNRDKAKVYVGDKLPVFTTTSTANVGVSASVSYLDVGLKLDVEPLVQLDNEVSIKITLEVSNLLREVSGPQGSLAYQVGTRLTTTSLRLKDGETQVLSGLINDEDRKRAVGVPGLAELPVVGRLFGVHSDTRNKTEIVLLITPHVIRNLVLPDAQLTTLASGTDALPGAAPLRLRSQARVGVALGSGAPATNAAAEPAAAEPPPGAVLTLAATREAAVGDTVSVTLANRSGYQVAGELVFDPARFQSAAATATGTLPTPGRAAFSISAQGDAVVVLRALPAAAGSSNSFTASSVTARDANGANVELRLQGDATVEIKPLPEAPK